MSFEFGHLQYTTTNHHACKLVWKDKARPTPVIITRDTMTHLCFGDPAPDFSLPDHNRALVTLSRVYRDRPVLLVFNIGFA